MATHLIIFMCHFSLLKLQYVLVRACTFGGCRNEKRNSMKQRLNVCTECLCRFSVISIQVVVSISYTGGLLRSLKHTFTQQWDPDTCVYVLYSENDSKLCTLNAELLDGDAW